MLDILCISIKWIMSTAAVICTQTMFILGGYIFDCSPMVEQIPPCNKELVHVDPVWAAGWPGCSRVRHKEALYG